MWDYNSPEIPSETLEPSDPTLISEIEPVQNNKTDDVALLAGSAIILFLGFFIYRK